MTRIDKLEENADVVIVVFVPTIQCTIPLTTQCTKHWRQRRSHKWKQAWEKIVIVWWWWWSCYYSEEGLPPG